MPLRSGQVVIYNNTAVVDATATATLAAYLRSKGVAFLSVRSQPVFSTASTASYTGEVGARVAGAPHPQAWVRTHGNMQPSCRMLRSDAGLGQRPDCAAAGLPIRVCVHEGVPDSAPERG